MRARLGPGAASPVSSGQPRAVIGLLTGTAGRRLRRSATIATERRVVGIVLIYRSRAPAAAPAAASLGCTTIQQHPLHRPLTSCWASRCPSPDGALHRPGPLRPGRRPGQQPCCACARAGPYPHLAMAQRPLIRANGHRRVRALMRIARRSSPLPSRLSLPRLVDCAGSRTPQPGTPYSRSVSVAPLTQPTPRQGPSRPGTSFESQTRHRPAADMRARPTGTSKRYDPPAVTPAPSLQ